MNHSNKFQFTFTLKIFPKMSNLDNLNGDIGDTIFQKHMHIRTHTHSVEKILIFIIGSIKAPMITFYCSNTLSNHSRFPIRGTSFASHCCVYKCVCVQQGKRIHTHSVQSSIFKRTWCEFNFCSGWFLSCTLLSSAYNCIPDSS